jgi:hypothetical protein
MAVSNRIMFMMQTKDGATEVGPRKWFDGQIKVIESMSAADNLPIGMLTVLRHMAMTIAELYERLESRENCEWCSPCSKHDPEVD